MKPSPQMLWLMPLLMLGAIIRLYQLGGESLWYDELYTVWASRLPLDVLAREVPASGHPPLYYLVGHVWFAFGQSEAWVRMISLTAGVVTIWLVYLLGLELFSRRVALWGAAIAAVSPYLVWYSRDATDYAWLIAVSTASLYFLVRSANRGGWKNWAGYVIATIAALLSHYYAAVLLIAELPVFFLLADWRKLLRPWLACEALIGLTLGPLFLYSRGAGRWTGTSIPGLLNAAEAIGAAPFVLFKGYPNRLDGASLELIMSTREIRGLVLALVLVTVALSVSGFLRRALFGRRLLALFVFLFLMLAGPVLLQLVRGELLLAGRYYAMAAPGLMLVLAVVISALPSRLGVVAGAVVMACMAVLLFHQYSSTNNVDWRGIMATIRENERPGDIIECFPLHNCVTAQSFYDTNLPLKGGWVTYQDENIVRKSTSEHGWLGYRNGMDQFPPLSGAELKKSIEEDTVGVDRVWLVSGTGETGNYPAAKNVEEALDNDWALEDSWDKGLLELKLYERKTI